MAYKKCPRCNLNYIKDVEVLCKICLDEVGKAIRANDLDEEEYDICPECGENIINVGEEMCNQCLMEQMKDEVSEESRKKDEWGDFLPKDDDEDIFEDDDEDEGLKDLEEINLEETDEESQYDNDTEEDLD